MTSCLAADDVPNTVTSPTAAQSCVAAIPTPPEEHEIYTEFTFITASKRSLGQRNLFTSMCHSVHSGGGVGGLLPGGICIQGWGGSASRGGVGQWAVRILLERILVLKYTCTIRLNFWKSHKMFLIAWSGIWLWESVLTMSSTSGFNTFWTDK